MSGVFTSHQSKVAVTGPQKAVSHNSWVWLRDEGDMVVEKRDRHTNMHGTDFKAS